MKLGFDLDGVICDFNSAFIPRVISITGRDLFPLRPFDIPCWDYPQYYGYSEEENKAVWKSVIEDRWFWETLPTYSSTWASLATILRRMLTGDDIYFITSRPSIDAKGQTERWLKARWPVRQTPNFTVLISSEKGLCARALKLDKYVDDKWENCIDVAISTENIDTYLMNRSWNYGRGAYHPLITRITSLDQMFPRV